MNDLNDIIQAIFKVISVLIIGNYAHASVNFKNCFPALFLM